VKTEDLPAGDSLEEICQFGFQFHTSNGMQFSTGNVDFSPDVFHRHTNTGQVKQQLVYCEVAVGRALVCDHDDPAFTSAAVTEGYDSLYIPQERVDRNDDGEITMDEYDAAANFDFRVPRYILYAW
jgi:hypothetical protein